MKRLLALSYLRVTIKREYHCQRSGNSKQKYSMVCVDALVILEVDSAQVARPLEGSPPASSKAASDWGKVDETAVSDFGVGCWADGTSCGPLITGSREPDVK